MTGPNPYPARVEHATVWHLGDTRITIHVPNGIPVLDAVDALVDAALEIRRSRAGQAPPKTVDRHADHLTAPGEYRTGILDACNIYRRNQDGADWHIGCMYTEDAGRRAVAALNSTADDTAGLDRYNLGEHGSRHIHDGDVETGVMFDPADACRLVAALNAYPEGEAS